MSLQGGLDASIQFKEEQTRSEVRFNYPYVNMRLMDLFRTLVMASAIL
jgi:hypothetical protein